jgi:hypothetical protein
MLCDLCLRLSNSDKKGLSKVEKGQVGGDLGLRSASCWAPIAPLAKALA